MMLDWTAEKIGFMRDASECCDYNQRLTEAIAPWLRRDMHLCDAGCGLGYLSLELAEVVRQVTAVDIAPRALEVLRENIGHRDIDNIDIHCGDILTQTLARSYDAMVFCFFGGMDEILEIAKKQCSGSVIVISRNYTHQRFSVGSYQTGAYGHAGAKAFLERCGIPYAEKQLELELGQPFRSFSDVRRFFETYSKDTDKSVLTDDFLLGKVIETGQTDYPYYMPHHRKVGILKFAAQDIQ